MNFDYIFVTLKNMELPKKFTKEILTEYSEAFMCFVEIEDYISLFFEYCVDMLVLEFVYTPQTNSVIDIEIQSRGDKSTFIDSIDGEFEFEILNKILEHINYNTFVPFDYDKYKIK